MFHDMLLEEKNQVTEFYIQCDSHYMLYDYEK